MRISNERKKEAEPKNPVFSLVATQSKSNNTEHSALELGLRQKFDEERQKILQSAKSGNQNALYEQIWDAYDVDKSEDLDKDETK